MFSLFIFLPTIAIVPHWTFLLIILYFIFGKKKIDKTAINSNFIIICAIIILSSVNVFIAMLTNVEVDIAIPFFYLLPLTYFIAYHLEEKELKLILYFIIFECLVVIYEFVMGINTIFPSIQNSNTLDFSENLLYFSRPFGLSSNSSTVASKIFFGFLIISFINLKKNIVKYISYSILIIALILTFNRTAIISVVAFLLFNYLVLIWKKIKRNRKQLFFLLSILMVIVFIIISNLDLLINQFTRGYGHVELTGRDIIWGIYSDYIKNHFLLGNNSQKYFINMDGNTYHAHNSYLQLLATNGFIISLFYFILIIINIKKNNFPYIFPVLLFALTQYVIFWGISLEDVFFLYFLLSPKYFRKDPKENTICESSDTIRGYCT